MNMEFMEDDQSEFSKEVKPSEYKAKRKSKETQTTYLSSTTSSTSSMRPSRSINLLRDAVLALVKVGSSASSGSNASQISSRVGTDLNDGSAARRGGADQVESALCD
jgi:hypothetical protein